MAWSRAGRPEPAQALTAVADAPTGLKDRHRRGEAARVQQGIAVDEHQVGHLADLDGPDLGIRDGIAQDDFIPDRVAAFGLSS